MKKFRESNNIGEVTDLVFDATEGKKFTTTEAIAKVLKAQGLKIVEIVSCEYIVIKYKDDAYLVFVTDTKPIEVLSVENDVNFHILPNDDE